MKDSKFWLNKLNLALRWLLQIDRPAPARAEAELAAEVERNFRWNYTVNLLDGVFFWLGVSFISSSTILPLFVSKLTLDPLLIGLVAVIGQSAWFLPQLLTANVVERLPRKKPVIVNLGFFVERMPLWVLIAAAPLSARAPALALALFLVCYAGHGLGAGIVATSWQDLIAKCIPVDRRGGFYGLTMFLGAGVGVAGATLSAWLLRTFPFPVNFTYAFTLAAIMITLSWVSIALTREPVRAIAAPRRDSRQFLAGLADIVRRDHNFRRFLSARLLMTLGSMGAGFITVSVVQRWRVPDSTVGIYTAVLLLGQMVGNLAFGFLADRFGHKLSLELGACSSCLSFGLAWLAHSAEWYYVVFALYGISTSAVVVSGILVVMEFCEPERRPTYTGIGNTGVGLMGIVAPLIGAALARVGYSWLFAASAGISLAALILMRWWVREPRHAADMR